MADGGDSSSKPSHKIGEDVLNPMSSAESFGPPDPKEVEVLSTTATAAVRREEALQQAEQGVQDSTETPVITMARAYQLEMCEESMKQNIIAVVSWLGY